MDREWLGVRQKRLSPRKRRIVLSGRRFLGVAVPVFSRADVRAAFHLSDDKFGYSGAISELKECKVKTLTLVVADYSNMTFNIIDQSFADMAISSSCE